MLRDLVLTFRLAWRTPLLVLVVVVTLGLGIGAALAVLGVLDAVLRRPLPYPAPGELVLTLGAAPEEGQPFEAVSYQTYRDWRRDNRVFRDLAAASVPRPFVLTGVDVPASVQAEVVSSNYFSLLGVSPLLGRTFTDEEELAPGAEPPVIVSHALWQSRLGGTRDVTSRSLRINDLSLRIVGVMPPYFRGLQWQPVDVWLPLGMATPLLGPQYRGRSIRWLTTIGRLGEGVTIERAREGMKQVAKGLQAEYPQHYHKRTVGLHPLALYYFAPELRQALLFLFVASLLVLVLCATNVAALLMVDVLRRRREIAIRLSLGAGVLRLVRQFTVQSVVFSSLGGVLALFLARWLTPHLVALSEIRPATFDDRYVGRPVLLASLGLVLLLGLSFGAIPPLLLSRLSLVGALKEGARSSLGSSGARWLRGAFVTLQITLGFVLVASASLLLQSLGDLTARSDPGFDTEDLLSVHVDLPAARYGDQQALRFAERLSERVGTLAGVRGVTVTGPNLAPLAFRTIQAATAGTLADGDDTGSITVHRHSVLPGFFSMLGIPLLEGRDFSAADDADHPAVVVVSRSVAELLWPDGSAVGSLLHLQPAAPTAETPPHVVIGVVADARHRGFLYGQEADLDVYFSLRQDPQHSFFLLLRSAADLRFLQGPIRSIGRELDSDVPLDRLKTMRQRFALAAADTRFHATLASLFASLAVLLAALGLYGVLTLSLREQRRELAVRLAIGASRSAIVGFILAQGARLLLPGLLLGGLVFLAVGPLLSAALYGVSPTDPWTLLFTAAILAVVGLAASLLPALAATKLDLARLLASE